MKAPNYFLNIQNATVRFLDKILFQNLNFRVENGDSWAIVGGSGKEKSAFLETILGRTSLVEGCIERPFAMAYQEEKSAKGKINSFRDLVALVSQKYPFKNKSNQQNFYYQQRFNSAEAEDTDTVGSHLLQVHSPVNGPWDKQLVMELFQLNALEDKSLIKLSNGESRRLSLAAALLKNPKLLLLDMPLTGLDVATRKRFDQILSKIISSGIQVIMTTAAEEVPGAIHKIGWLKEGKLEIVNNRKILTSVDKVSGAASSGRNRALESLLGNYPIQPYQTLVGFNHVTIRYGEKTLLNQVVWRVCQGECWLIKGHNGAGKSTLISLILGENPQAYANDITLFDRKRGTGESIWDVKRPIGFVSPELSRYFPTNQTCLKVVLSGLFDTMGLFKKVNADQEALGIQWLSVFGLSHLAHLGLSRVSLEEQRFCLLARALIKHPQLLVLDEASQGMDEEMRVTFKNTIDQIIAQTGLTLIFVSHYEEDVPDAVNKILVLEEGSVKSKQT